MKKKILILGNSQLVVFGFRGELIKALIDDGYKIITAFPKGPFGEGEKTSLKYGCDFIEIPMNRRGKNPFEDILLLFRYIKILKEVSPDIVLMYTVKCDIYGGIACELLKIPYIPNITGLGKGLSEGGIVGKITKILYQISIKNAQCVFFQNTSDKKFFDDNKINYKKGIVLPGSGVNIKRFVPLAYPDDKKIIFTYIARIMKAKGIEQFLDAARELHSETIEFHVCGYCEEDYKNSINCAEKNGIIIYHGLVDNVVEFEKISHCIVLPTFHPEGISNVLLEAAACARPIIATNRPGCREVVDSGINGYLVKEHDSDDLIRKIRNFLSLSNEEREKMGIAGRLKIEKEFDREFIVQEYLREIK